MSATLPFGQVVADRHAWIKRYKAETGRQVAGYFCDYVPEELLWAAGYATVRVTGGRGEVVSADKYLQSNVCSFARRCFDQALDGVFNYLDALVIPHTCDVINKIYDLWAYRMKDPSFLHYLWVPHKVFDRDATAVMLGEFRRLRQGLEEHRGAPISDEAIREAIRIYDRYRSLLKRIYALRRTDPPGLTGTEAFTVSLAGILAPKDVAIGWMEKLLTEERPALPAGRRPRILIAASMLDDADLVRAVEASGAWVVADDVCTGSRYFWDLVGEEEADPMKALVARYLNKVPCPRSFESLAPRWRHLEALCRDYRVDGVIFYILRCCDAHLFQYPLLRERLEKAGVRHLYLQGDQTAGIGEAVSNRIQAFTETLGS
jgi:benzoyl-CoA reductase subunit C